MTDTTNFYFQSYNEWRHTITERCNIKLTADYARSRITALQNPSDKTTEEFISTYGEAYLAQVIRWFEQAEREN